MSDSKEIADRITNLMVDGGPNFKEGLTPVSEQAVKEFYQGLVAMLPTIQYSAYAQAGIAITPSMKELLIHHCSNEPEFNDVLGLVYVVSYRDMKKSSILDF
ncbi:hypothetical protein [Vibrio coralliilyticus]|uniref:Uncharacterized protein n=1 Tax=Vibrio coralliilyticus TaxID=190893 RepID=A0AAP6ZND2_9VIBR|nr:hypothetical protein [Vibrio coralliilyticus]NOI32030.1 hypothetical protein [Vibrio coralliilyticus]NOJ25231.1 hypothetical protein [Vibrio coralliilyticus]